jgi:hypothetical protein
MKATVWLLDWGGTGPDSLDFSVLVTTEVEEGVSVKRYKLRNQFLCSQKTFQ